MVFDILVMVVPPLCVVMMNCISLRELKEIRRQNELLWEVTHTLASQKKRGGDT